MIDWQIILAIAGIVVIGVCSSLISVMVGGWLVWRSKPETRPLPFLSGISKGKPKEPYSYVSELFQDEPADIMDEELSPAAARLRDQKFTPEEQKKRILSVVTGKGR